MPLAVVLNFDIIRDDLYVPRVLFSYEVRKHMPDDGCHSAAWFSGSNPISDVLVN
jgi:hypothetical protein